MELTCGETYRTRNAAASQPLSPRFLRVWVQAHFSLGSWLLVVFGPRGRWVSEDGIVAGGGNTRRRGHVVVRVG